MTDKCIGKYNFTQDEDEKLILHRKYNFIQDVDDSHISA